MDLTQPNPRLGFLPCTLHVATIGQFYFGDGSRFGEVERLARKRNKIMASNELPRANDKLFTLAARMIKGVHDLEVTLGIKQNTETVMAGALAAAETSETAYGNKGVEKKAANAIVKEADDAGKTFIGNSKKRLSKFFGEKASTEWEGAGWPQGSTAVPTTMDERQALIKRLKKHFEDNPAHESADMDATAALADAAWNAINNARALLDTKITEVGQAKVTRDAAVRNLRDRMNGLIDELDLLLPDDDPRWHKFGLSAPADPELPEPPSFTTAVPSVPGTGLIDWDDPVRAERYRVWIFIVGVDTDWRAVGSPEDSDFTLTGLTSGQTVKVRVTSKNEAGESQPGPEAQFVVP